MALAWKAGWVKALESSNLSPSARNYLSRFKRRLRAALSYNALMSLIVASLILLLLAIAGAFYVIFGWVNLTNKIGYVPVPNGLLPQIVSALELAPGDMLYDLGCGDGRVLTAAFESRPSISAVGVENNPLVYAAARRLSPSQVRLRLGNLFDVDLTDATVVFAYLHPDLNRALILKLEIELRSGTRVVTLQFPLPGWTPSQTVELSGAPAYASRLYVYDIE